MTSDADIGDCTKSCRDISRLFKDYLVALGAVAHLFVSNLMLR